VRRKVLQKCATAHGRADEEDRVDQFAHLPGPMSAGLGRRRLEKGKYVPFSIRQITRIAQVVPIMLGSGFAGPHQGLQDKKGLTS
jgi:hypothetical protein